MSYYEDRYIEWLAERDAEFGGDAWAGHPGNIEERLAMGMASYYDDGGQGWLEDEEKERQLIATRRAAAKLDTQLNVTPQFVLAGDATFTVSNGDGAHFTYNVNKSTPNPQFPGDTWFIHVLVGPDNSNDFHYMGKVEVNLRHPKLDPFIKLTGKSRVNQDTPSYKVATWALRAIWQIARGEYQMPPGYSIKHAGQCGRCGAKLTHPASLDTGLGPGCAEQMGVEWAERTAQPGSMYDFAKGDK